MTTPLTSPLPSREGRSGQRSVDPLGSVESQRRAGEGGVQSPILEVAAVSRHFGGVKAVTDMSLDIHQGELLSVIGPNGAGKTTLFNLIAGQDRPDAGRIHLNGAETTAHTPEQMAEAGLARTFQHGRVFANLTVLENVLIGAHPRLHAARRGPPLLGSVLEIIRGLVRPPAATTEDRQLVDEATAIIATFGDRLTPRLHNPAHSLSYANRRRVEIARALMLRPRILLLDEPTAGMNQTETAEMLTLLRTLKSAGQTILPHRAQARTRLSSSATASSPWTTATRSPKALPPPSETTRP